MYIILFHFTDCFVMFMKGFVCVSEWVETLWYGGTNCHVTVTMTTYWRTCLLTTEKMRPFFTHGFSWDWSLRPILKGCQIGYTWCVYEGKTTREIFCSKSTIRTLQKWNPNRTPYVGFISSIADLHYQSFNSASPLVVFHRKRILCLHTQVLRQRLKRAGIFTCMH